MRITIPTKYFIFDILAAILILISFVLVMFFTPVEMTMGLVQKIFYFHVAHAWIGMLSFIVAAAASVLFLISNNSMNDFIAESAVEIGLYFTIIAVVSGSIWAKPAWNTWWTWDPRLTTTTIMAFIYAGYQFLRQSLDNPEKKSRILALYCIIGCISVPLTFFSIRGYRSIHPVLIGSESQGMNMTEPMIATMIISIFSFTILYLALMHHRVLYAKIKEETEAEKYEMELEDERNS